MNILALNWNDLKNPFGGGAEVHFEELLRRLVSFGHTVTLVCSGWDDSADQETIEGIKIIRRGNRYNFNLVVPFLLRRLIRENRYDILIEDINKIPFYTPLYTKIKRLVVIPHLFATTVFQEVNPILATYVFLAEKPLVPLYKRYKFNVISASTADDIAIRGIPRDNISIIHCGIDRKVYSPDPTVTKYEQPTILYLGRIKKYKSIQHVISALVRVKTKLPDARLMVVGDGDYLPELKKLAMSVGLADDVEFTGYVAQADKIERMRRSHVAVLPSLKEGWGLTNIESNAVGTAVVAANSPGLRDSVDDGNSGFLYEYGNIDELAEKLMLVLSDADTRQKLEQGGLKWAEKFDWDSAAHEFEELLLEIVEPA